MTVSESRRRALHAGLVDSLGAEVADTLMDHLPPAGWSDVARQSDLDNLERRLGLQIEALEARLEAKISDRLSSQTRWFMASQLVLVAATIGSITGLAH